MATSLRMVCFNIWKSKQERQGTRPQYEPVFTRYIGVEDVSEYPDLLKTLYTRSQSCPYSIFFDGTIPMQAEFDIIDYVSRELKSMDVHNLKTQDISLFNDSNMDSVFLEALDKTVNAALDKETFFNESSRNDFIIKLIVWTFSYVRPIVPNLNPNHSPKCFYYGDITRHEIYFLIMLHLMGFDVVYINSLRDENWASIDSEKMSSLVSGSNIVQIKPLKDYLESGTEISEEQSVTLQLQREMEETLFSGSGVYRSWQFREGNTKSLFIRGTVFDLLHSFAEPARVRAGFKTEGKLVTVPNFFFQVDGVYGNKEEYYNLINTCITTPNTMVLDDAGAGLIGENVSDEEKLKLTFCKLSDGSYDIQELKKLGYYQWDKYRDSLEDFMLNKINEVLKSGMYKHKFSTNEEFDFVCDILMMDSRIIKMADGFDFTDKVPKLVIFLNKEEFVEDRILYLLGYIVTLGFDVVIFSPSGLISIDSVFEVSRFNNERLDTMQYDLTLEDVKKKPKGKGLFQRLFK